MDLSQRLLALRHGQDRSRRWVERQSRRLYPEARPRQISHSYLRQLEDGTRSSPSPLKLRTLAEIYGIDVQSLLVAAGYVDTPDGQRRPPHPEVTPAVPSADAGRELGLRMIHKLEAEGIHSAYFINSILKLTPESLQIVARLITTLSLQEEQLRSRGATPPVPDPDASKPL